MLTADELYLKGLNLWIELDEEDERLHRQQLLAASSYLEEAIGACQNPPSYMFATFSRVLLALGATEKAINSALQAIKCSAYEFEGYYTLYLVGYSEFYSKGGLEANSKTKVSWGKLLLGAVLAPEVTSREIADHYCPKLGKKWNTKEHKKQLLELYSKMNFSFIWKMSHEFNPDTTLFMVQVLLSEAEIMQYIGYDIKVVYQNIVQELSKPRQYGSLSDEIDSLRAQALGALHLM